MKDSLSEKFCDTLDCIEDLRDIFVCDSRSPERYIADLNDCIKDIKSRLRGSKNGAAAWQAYRYAEFKETQAVNILARNEEKKQELNERWRGTFETIDFSADQKSVDTEILF